MPSRQLRCLRHCINAVSKRRFSTASTIREYDTILIRQYGAKRSKYRLTKPLRYGEEVKLSHGAVLNASDIIGKGYLDKATDSGGNTTLFHELSLATYIANTSRDATPIYAHDASNIVSLLDIHPRAYAASEEEGEDSSLNLEPPLEIFEAGTGMGSLTIHLARAIHAANAPLPPSILRSLLAAPMQPLTADLSNHNYLSLDPSAHTAYKEYLASRSAIVHSLDHSKKHSHAAYKLIRNFRRAQYLPSIDFHVGTVNSFLSAQLAKRNDQPFLSHAVLDLPSAHEHAAVVIEALRTNGVLVLFKPSISQIGEFEQWARRTEQPIRQEKVLELPNASFSSRELDVSGGGGGRTWDVKTTVPRASLVTAQHQRADPVQIMRPKVGGLIVGGGFVAVYRRYPGQARSEPVEDAIGGMTQERPGISTSRGWFSRLFGLG